MQQYPNYCQMPMGAMNNFNNQFNPYLQRMENLQQFQQVMHQQPMQYPIGKVVENVDMVRVTDIPMDGNLYYFPKADGTEVYAKQFLQNGQTRILTFKATLDDTPSNLPIEVEKSNTDDFRGILMGIVDDISDLKDIVSQLSNAKTVQKVQKDD